MREKKHSGWRDNRGAALILVIVCIAFVGILGVTILKATVTNRNMKLVDEKAKENFYSTESGVDIFLVNLQSLSEDMLGEEYAHLLTHYGVVGREQVKEGVKKRLWMELTGEYECADGMIAPVLKEEAEALFAGVEGYGTTFKLRNYADKTAIMARVDGEELVLMNLSITNIEKGYETQITTDVRVAIEFEELNIETPVMVPGAYEGYVIISDGTVKNHLTASNVSGSVYAGRDLLAEYNSALTLRSNQIIVGKTLKTAVGGKLDINSYWSGNVRVWAGNIATTAGSGGQSIAIGNGECYVADDLVLGAEDSDVTISGSYYGYNSGIGTLAMTGAETSSAITINAGNSNLDLSGLNTLWLAGKSFVTVPDIYGVSDTASYTEIMEGETISYKGNQLAYLVPEMCIKDYEHNPLTKAEYDAIVANGGMASYIDTSVSFGESASMNLAPYVNASMPCEVVPVRFMSEPEPLYYIYLKFRSSQAAEDYFLAYSNAYQAQLDSYSEILELGDVSLPASDNIYTSGTVLRVQDHKITEVVEGTMTVDQATVKQLDYKRKFEGLLRALDEYSIGVGDNTVVENILRISEINEISGANYYFFDEAYEPCVGGGAKYQVIVSNGNFSGASQNITGLILADGDVDLSGSTFRGMVIATGDVTLNAMTMSDTNADGSGFVQALLDNNTSINRFFNNYPLVDEDDDEEEAAEGKNITITLENWYKN
ncbi:MAG: hypothetical protein IJY09_04370 [Lachnospiraceae bacterium]|nr:hypothetical protein [Lachnospiraceae bacterium]